MIKPGPVPIMTGISYHFKSFSIIKHIEHIVHYNYCLFSTWNDILWRGIIQWLGLNVSHSTISNMIVSAHTQVWSLSCRVYMYEWCPCGVHAGLMLTFHGKEGPSLLSVNWYDIRTIISFICFQPILTSAFPNADPWGDIEADRWADTGCRPGIAGQ